MGVPTPTLRHLLPTNPHNPDLTFAVENNLFHTVNARIQQTNPTHGRTRTLPREATRNVLSISYANSLLLTVDDASHVAVLALPSARVLSRITLNFSVSAAAISPSGAYAAFVGQQVEIWSLPRSPVPQVGGWSRIARFASSGTCVAWSMDETRVAVGTNRLATVYSVQRRKSGVHVKPLLLHGHREAVASVSFVGKRGLITLSSDGVLLCWRLQLCDQNTNQCTSEYTFSNQNERNLRKRLFEVPVVAKLASRHFVKKAGARAATCAHVRDGMLAVGMSNGMFALYQLPDSMASEDVDFDHGLFEIGRMRKRKRMAQGSEETSNKDEEDLLDEIIPVKPFTDLTVLHTLSVSNGSISRIKFNDTGDWVGLSSASGHIVIWDWRAETYVMKQQAHAVEPTSVAFSPDGSAVATGAKDGQVKLWGLSSGFCVTTFATHSAAVSSLTFSAKDVLISASYDGSVRAYDLRKYRNFRTMVGPPPNRQFACVAVDAAGDLVAAGCRESFEVVVWSLRTGQILELLNGHKGPVSGISFRPRRGTLATASWDRTVRLWDMYERKGSCEVLEHSKEVLDVSFRPDGSEFASCTAAGEIVLWSSEKASIVGTVDGARDAAHGRLRESRTVAPLKGHFRTVCYNADGRFLIAGAASKNVCIYHVSEGSRPTLVNRIAVTQNQDFDGLLDELNSKNLSSSGRVVDTIGNDSNEEAIQQMLYTGGDPLLAQITEKERRQKKLVMAEVNCVRACTTGRLWAAVTSEGVLIYGDADEDEYGETLFDPANLETDVTPLAARRAAQKHDYVLATTIALRLNERDCLNAVIELVPFENVHRLVNALPALYFNRLIHLFSWRLDNTPHLEFNLVWARRLMLAQGARAHNHVANSASVTAALRVLGKACSAHSKRLRPLIDKNGHMLQYLRSRATRDRVLADGAELIET